MTAEEYVAIVLDRLPRDTPMREQIAAELRAHIDDRVRQGAALEVVLHQLGDPEKLAESYVSAIPLDRVPFGERVAAKLIDITLCIAPVMLLAYLLVPRDSRPGLAVVCAVLVGCPLFMIYTIVSESSTDQTIGKRFMHTRVVRETGTRISGGQAVVRQLPWLLQIFLIDACFALFTERHQRAFEMLSKTCVVRVPSPEAA